MCFVEYYCAFLSSFVSFIIFSLSLSFPLFPSFIPCILPSSLPLSLLPSLPQVFWLQWDLSVFLTNQWLTVSWISPSFFPSFPSFFLVFCIESSVSSMLRKCRIISDPSQTHFYFDNWVKVACFFLAFLFMNIHNHLVSLITLLLFIWITYPSRWKFQDYFEPQKHKTCAFKLLQNSCKLSLFLLTFLTMYFQIANTQGC